MQNEFEEIDKIVKAVRLALETDSVKKSLVGLNNFPFGACLDASLLLGEILSKAGFIGFSMICGEKEGTDESNHWFEKSHAWLENDRYLIDITPDQFGFEGSHIVLMKSKSVDCHLGFTPIGKSELNLEYTAWALPALKAELGK
jgi:hypothetical protein